MKRTKTKKKSKSSEREAATSAGVAETTPSDTPTDEVSKQADAPLPGNLESDAAKTEAPNDPSTRIEKLEDALLRAKADYQNLQRRLTGERADAIRYANADLMKSLLGVVDDFERSLEAAKSSDNLAAVVEGVRLVYENLNKALANHGLEPVDALHQQFDPNIHEALMQQPSSEHPDNTVIEQVARGYRLRERVLRPAKVVVSKAPETAKDEPAETSDETSEPKAK